MKSVAIFCGSHIGNNELFAIHAQQLGRLLAGKGIRLIYGGGAKGLMGALADACLQAGGEVIGVIPEKLRSWEHQHNGLTQLHIVPDMHARKRLMYELAQAAIILPGGFGTMDEMFEMLTWNQLDIHDKHIYILNSGGFFTDLFQLMQVMQREGFLYNRLEDRITIDDLPDNLVARMLA